MQSHSGRRLCYDVMDTLDEGTMAAGCTTIRHRIVYTRRRTSHARAHKCAAPRIPRVVKTNHERDHNVRNVQINIMHNQG